MFEAYVFATPRRLAVAGLVLALSALSGVYCAGRSAGILAGDRTAAAVESRLRADATAAARLSADSLERLTADLAKLAALSRGSVRRAVGRTDSAVVVAAAAWEAAQDALSDAEASAAWLRVTLDSLARADLEVRRVFHDERLAAAGRSALDSTALATAVATIAAKNVVILRSAEQVDGLTRRIAALEGARPGAARRGVAGVAAGAAGFLCGAAGYAVAGPLWAAGGGVACAGLAGMFVR